MPEHKRWNHFTEEEVKNLDTEFIAKLDMARHRANVPFVITSGFRTPEHNFSVGGVEGSSHTKGLAVDILCNSDNQLWHILDGLFSVGIKRIGIYYVVINNLMSPRHIHIDYDMSKPQSVVFFKMENNFI